MGSASSAAGDRTGRDQPDPVPSDRGRSRSPSRHRVRSWLAGTLVVIGGVLGPVALVANWARTVAIDDDAYVAAVAPLATDPAVTGALEARLVTAVMNAVDNVGVSDQVTQYLAAHDVPDAVAGAVTTALGALNGGIRELATTVVGNVVESPTFATAWEKINRTAHQQFVKAMNGDSVLLDKDGNLALQLEPILAQVRDRLVAQGYSWASKIPASSAEYVLVPADDVATVRTYYSYLVRWLLVLVIAALCALIGAVVLAPDRRRGIAHAFAALGCGTVVVGLLLRFGVNALSKRAASPEAAHAIFTTVTAGLTNWIRTVALISLIVAVLVTVWGPGHQRDRIRAALIKVRTSLSSPPLVGPKRLVCGLLAVVGVIVLLFVQSLSPVGTAVVLLVVLITAVLAIVPGHEPVRATAGPRDRAR